MFKKIFVIVSVLLAGSVQAEQLSVIGKHTSDTECEYFSTTTGEFTFDFKEQLDWGARVYLKYALKQSYSCSEWHSETVVEMVPAAPYTWSTTIVETLNARGSFSNQHINFVILIDHPDGTHQVVKGNNSRWGYLRAIAPHLNCKKDVEMEKVEVVDIWND